MRKIQYRGPWTHQGSLIQPNKGNRKGPGHQEVRGDRAPSWEAGRHLHGVSDWTLKAKSKVGLGPRLGAESLFRPSICQHGGHSPGLRLRLAVAALLPHTSL